MKTISCLILIFAFSIAVQGCGRKGKQSDTETSNNDAGATVLADNPNARLSEVMQLMRGRWVKEIPDPNRPNPPVMRLFAVADDQMEGRLLFAGAYADTGVLVRFVKVGEQYTMTLIDDELRPHDWIPKERVLSGTFNAEKRELELKSADGTEYMKFLLPGGFAIKFTGNVYRCMTVPIPTGPSGGSGSSGGSGGGSTPAPTPTPAPARRTLEYTLDRPSPTPSPRPSAPPARVQACGIGSFWEEDWSRMSGSGE